MEHFCIMIVPELPELLFTVFDIQSSVTAKVISLYVESE